MRANRSGVQASTNWISKLLLNSLSFVMSFSLVSRSLRTSVQSRQISRAFSLSTRRNEHFLNVNAEVRLVTKCGVSICVDIQTLQGFDKAISAERSKDRVVLVDFYAE